MTVATIRPAKAEDAQAIAELIALLGHRLSLRQVRDNLASCAAQDVPQLVAEQNGKAVGLCGLNVMRAIHRPAPAGRITILVVAEESRGRGLGRRLTEAAEDVLKGLGCAMVEVTSNDRLTDAHAFYRHLGYERTSIRLFKTL